MTARHKPGTVYACDARRYGADQNLCPLHREAEAMRDLIAQLVTAVDGQETVNPIDDAWLTTARETLRRAQQ
jgi:hypothetical protein